MSQEFLSVCVPTYNRAPVLKQLLERFAKQVREAGLTERDIAFYFVDNASPDETPKVIEEFRREVPQVHSVRNETNIGMHRNVLKVYTQPRGLYCWGIGDDEILCDGAVAGVLKALREKEPGLLIAFNSRYDLRIPTPQLFPNYHAFAKACLQRNPHALAEHTLISSNIFRSENFDYALGEAHVKMYFPNMFGLMGPLIRRRLSVYLPDFPIITVREAAPGAGPSDGVWSDLDQCWIYYLSWLREALEMPELDPTAPSRWARGLMLANLRAHPFQYFWNHRTALFQPSAYRFVFSRLFRPLWHRFTRRPKS
jgi:glycosyltransferase involved in cell wall biosynthesis